MSIKLCEIYIVKDFFYIVTMGKTVPGFWMSCEPMIKVERSDAPIQLGSAVLESLLSSKQNLLVPTNPRSVRKSLLMFVGVKSWCALENVAGHLSVCLDDEEIEITPSRLGNRGGYNPIPEKKVKCLAEPLEIAEAIINIMDDLN
jgi:hypothetical protein